MKKYELITILDSSNKEDAMNDIVQRIGREIESGGGKLDEIEHLGKKDFAYTPKNIKDGYYVNFKFESDTNLITKLRETLALDSDVKLQHYQKA